MRTIMGIEIQNREELAVKVQGLLTKHGCVIKTRLGLHETGNFCSPSGLIILEFAPDDSGEYATLENELNELEGVVARRMEF
jgi:ribose 5-phosphate isomerase